MAITAATVKDLRDRTGLPMMKCKEALVATDGDIEAAIEHLRKQGLATAGKKSGRATSAGTLAIATEGGKGTVVLIACETDFVGSNDEFKAFAGEVAAVALATGAADLEALGQASLGDTTVADALVAKIQKLGENMQLAEVAHLAGETVVGYNHGGRVATMIAGAGDEDALRNIAMHVAAANPAPVATDRGGVDAALLARERSIIEALPDVQAKPEQIRPKIVEGKLGRFYKEHVLLEQEMLVDNEDGVSVGHYAKAKGATVSGFARLAI